MIKNILLTVFSVFVLVQNAAAFDLIEDLQRSMIKDIAPIEELQRNAHDQVIQNLAPTSALSFRGPLTSRSLNEIDPRIVGGKPTTIEENPWQVALIHGGTPDFVREQFCGGSLIRSDVVLTAAHCVDWLADAAGVNVVAGSTYYQHGGERIRVKEIEIHPQWDSSSNSHDFAILVLEGSSQLGTPIDTVGQSQLLSSNQKVVVSGWGRLSEGGASSQILMHVAVPIVDNAACNAPGSYNGAINAQMFCAGFRDGGYDSCQGDSGGPVYSIFDDKVSLVGVVSWGHGCARRNKYGVYSRISSVLDWIDSTI